MADRHDRDGHEFRDNQYETSVKHAHTFREDDYYDDQASASQQSAQDYADDDQGPEWTYDEKTEQWIDRDGNPYVEAYAEGEEDRYAPAGDDEYLAPRAEARLPKRKSHGSAVSVAALVLVAFIGVSGAYVWKKGGFVGSDLPGIGSAPPVIKANPDPVKIKPAQTTASADQATHEIFDRSKQPVSPASERVVRHEEQPVAVVPVRPEGTGTVAAAPTANATRPVATSNITLPPADTGATPDQAAGAAEDVSTADAPDNPRRVKTIKIMPDNSVVTGEAPISGTDAAPAPATRSVDVATVTPADTSIANAPSPQEAPATTTQPVVTTQPAVPATDPAAASTVAPVTTSPVTTVPAVPVTSAPPATPPGADAGADDNANTTVVEPTHAEAAPPAVPPVRPRNIPTTTTQTASAEPVAPASNGTYVVQVSSQRSPADAQAAFQSLQRKYASVIGSMKPSIRKVDLPDRGTYYRVRVGSWSSPAEATAFCAKLKEAGGDCVIARN